jgi:hypothetical protein
MAKLKIRTTTSVTGVTYPQPQDDAFISPTLINGYHIGGVGGLTSQAGLQIQPQVYVKGGSSTTGSIIAQKGAHKFRVTDGTYTGDCTLVNNPNLTAGQMNILITLNTAAANIAAANVAGNATSTTFSYDSRTTVTGPVQTPRVGDYAIWTSPSANISGVAKITAVSSGSYTIATTGNVAWANGVSVSTSTYASRITNKFVYDFTSDGQQDSTSGTVTYYTSGYNPNRYRYVLSSSAGPNATFVKVQSA